MNQQKNQIINSRFHHLVGPWAAQDGMCCWEPKLELLLEGDEASEKNCTAHELWVFPKKRVRRIS